MRKTREELKPKTPFKRGIYKHSKSGVLYHAAAIGRHSETLEELVIYYESNLNGKVVEEPLWWVRPVEMFSELVEVDGEQVPRFQLVYGL